MIQRVKRLLVEFEDGSQKELRAFTDAAKRCEGEAVPEDLADQFRRWLAQWLVEQARNLEEGGDPGLVAVLLERTADELAAHVLPFRCPNCDGWGMRQATGALDMGKVHCDSCDGTGLVWR